MSMVEVRHRASEALQKPSMHETAGHKSRLWIFDQVSSGAAERKQETNAPSRSEDDGKLGVLQAAWVTLLDRSRRPEQPRQSMVVAMTAV
jgi:hypothetical protein